VAKHKKAEDKSLVEKAKDAIDHVLHPNQPTEPELKAEEPEAEKPPVVSAEDSDMCNHPKFDKFKN